MDTRTIGSLSVTVVGLGCNNFGRRLDAERSAGVVNAALDAGINFFDTADIYGMGQSEEYLGRALGQRRSQVVIATKFGNAIEGQGKGASADYVRKAVEASLRRLGTDYIDLYQLHIPDPSVPIEETLGALDELVKAGKVREIGSSNFSADQVRAADAAAQQKGTARFVSAQNHYSLVHREPEAELLPECERLKLALLPYFPLAGGLLTGKAHRGEAAPSDSRLSEPNNQRWLTDQNFAIVEALTPFAEAHGHSLAELAIAWLLGRPVVASVIAGATKAEQVQMNVAAGGWRLTADDMAEIDSLVTQTT